MSNCAPPASRRHRPRLRRSGRGFAGADLTEYEVLLGARHDWKLDRFRPFAELLTGLAHHSESFAAPEGAIESGGTHFAVGPSLGADYRLSPSWRARFGFYVFGSARP